MSGENLIQQNERMAQLSIVYVKALASYLGYGVDTPTVDHDSVDLTISSSRGKKGKLDIQLKSTTKVEVEKLSLNKFPFEIPVNNYNDLKGETICPRILVVFCMPNNASEWIEHSKEQLIVRKCAYWLSLQGLPDSTNKKSVTIKIPTSNVLCPVTLDKLMKQIDRGEAINNDY